MDTPVTNVDNAKMGHYWIYKGQTMYNRSQNMNQCQTHYSHFKKLDLKRSDSYVMSGEIQ